MKKISLLLAIILTLAILLCGCGASSNMSADMYMPSGGDSAPAPSSEPQVDSGYYGVEDKAESMVSTGSTVYENPENKIIRTANLTIQTTEFDAAVETLRALTEQYGGYFETSKVYGGSYYNQNANRSASYVVRIPSQNYGAFLAGTGGIGYVYSMSENSVDVGEQYYDTETRLATLKTKHDRLLSLLEKADKMEDIISLQDALSDVEYQIDQYTSTLRRYDSLIGFSTFNISIEEVQKIVEQPTVTQSFGDRLLSNLKRGFEDFGEGLQDFALWFARNLIGIVIFLAIVVVVIVVAVRRIRRRRAKKIAE